MNIDTLFILCAGKGTRMGPIGDHLPKPLWPIFEKSLLELQLEFYRHLPVKKKFINTHHLAGKMHHFAASLPINILHEPELLDVGGAILNLKKHDPSLNHVLISNVDQFLIVDWAEIKKRISSKPFTTLLFATRVHKDQGYHQLQVSPQGKLLGINKRPTDDHYLTYSGTALIDLTKIHLPPQHIGFFNSIADPSQHDVQVLDAKSDLYYDFGTHDLYVKQIQTLANDLRQGSPGPFLYFLLESGGVDPNKFNPALNSYQSNRPNELQFKQLKMNLSDPPSIRWPGYVG